jgi:hypothetical protein
VRGYYFQYAPELVDYLLSVPPAQRLNIQGLRGAPWQIFVTVAGMVSVVTAVLAGDQRGDQWLPRHDGGKQTGCRAGVLVAIAVLIVLMRRQTAAWQRANKYRCSPTSRSADLDNRRWWADAVGGAESG